MATTIERYKEAVKAWLTAAALALEGDDWNAVCDALLAADSYALKARDLAKQQPAIAA